MKKILVILLLPLLGQTQNLKEMLEYASHHNYQLLSKAYHSKAKHARLEAVKNSTYPSIDVGGFYQNLDERNLGMAGSTVSTYAKVQFDVYDGGKRKALTKQKMYELHSSKFEKKAFEKSLSLGIMQDYFTIKSLNASLNSLHEEKKSLQAQLKRIKKFVDASLATNDDMYKLQSAYDKNTYSIASLKFDKLSLYKGLELKLNSKIKTIGSSKFKKQKVRFELNDAVNALKMQEKAIQAQAESIQSDYNPKVHIEDTYNFYEYGQTDPMHPSGVGQQNTLLLSVNMRIYDNDTIEKNRVAVLREKDALNEQLNYSMAEQRMLFRLAKSRIETNKEHIKSATSAVKSSASTYEIIEEKYKAGIVDNIAYLDALSQKTNAKALYHRSLNSLEIAYGIYYYYAGKNIRKYLK